MGRASSFGAGEMKRVKSFEAALLQCHAAFLDSVRKRDVLRGQSQTFLNPFHATVAKGVQDTAYRHGYSVFLCNTDEDPAKEREYLQLFAGQQLRGLIIVPTERTKTNLKVVKGFPVVEFDRSSGTLGAHVVVSENREGARAAVQHLIQAGHKRIGMVSGCS